MELACQSRMAHEVGHKCSFYLSEGGCGGGLARIPNLGFPACSYEQFGRVAMIEVSEDGVLGNRRLIPVQRARHLTNVLRSGPKVPLEEVSPGRVVGISDKWSAENPEITAY